MGTNLKLACELGNTVQLASYDTGSPIKCLRTMSHQRGDPFLFFISSYPEDLRRVRSLCGAYQRWPAGRGVERLHCETNRFFGAKEEGFELCADPMDVVHRAIRGEMETSQVLGHDHRTFSFWGAAAVYQPIHSCRRPEHQAVITLASFGVIKDTDRRLPAARYQVAHAFILTQPLVMYSRSITCPLAQVMRPVLQLFHSQMNKTQKIRPVLTFCYKYPF